MYIEEHSQGGYMKKNNQGFTLLEMTIVVIIISVIFLLSVPSIQRHCRLSIIKDARQLKKLQMRQFLSTRWNMMSIHRVWMI